MGREPTNDSQPTVGILAIQGDVAEHRHILLQLGVSVREVRLPGDLAGLDGLILPGGESTTMANLMHAYGLWEPIQQCIGDGLPTWGTCAGMILLASRLTGDRPQPLGLLDITVSRNAFGRQVDSFERPLQITGVEGGPFLGVFIRAPVIDELGPGVEVLARLPDGRPVAVRQNNMLASAFHPELTDDPRFHMLFISAISGNRVAATTSSIATGG